MCHSIWWSGQGLFHEQVSVAFDKGESSCILMQYEIKLIYTFGVIAFKLMCILFTFLNDYDVETCYWSAFPYNSKFTLTSKIAWNKHGRYKEGWLY